MNILFIEDERELRESGVAQLELHRYTVYPVSNLVEAREIMDDPATPVHLVIADHCLPDGQGVQFVIEMKELFPKCQYVIVSGCLTDANISELKEKEIPYFVKPLLYGKVVEEFRRKHLLKGAAKEPLPEAADGDGAAKEPLPEAADGDGAAEASSDAADATPESSKEKKWFGLFKK